MTEFTVRDPDYETIIRAALGAQGLMKLYGVEVREVRPGYVEMAVAYRDELCQHDGFFHGGVVGALADVAAAAAAGTLVVPDMYVLTAEYKINILAPGAGERLVVRSQVIKPGRRLSICRSDCFVVTGGEEKLCATALATIANLPARAPKEAGDGTA